MRIKDKLKSFFDLFFIKKDFKKEDCTKTFEKIKLFTLTKERLFLGMLFFLAIVNTLVALDINQFYIRAILSFLFITIIPGLLIMLCFKIRKLGFWEYLVYTVGLSISFIMFAGLAVNWILPWLGITDKPLATFPILICFNIFLITLGITAWKRNKDLKPFDITTPKLDWINRIFFIVPLCFPALAILGAFLLNNYGTNILTIIMIGGISTYVLLITLFKKHLNENVYPWSLFFIGLSLLLMFTMRSWHISGGDIIAEFQMFETTSEFAVWKISNFYHTYNACLSLTILPTIFNIFIKINPQIIYKIFMQLIFSLVPITLFLFSRKFLNSNSSFLSSFFFISFEGFIFSSPMHIRQEIAFLFLSLFILILFSKKFEHKEKSILTIIFTSSIVLSHYSTSYFLAFFLICLLLILFAIKKIFKQNTRYISVIIMILFLLFTFLWYSQLTNSSSGIIDFLGDSVSNIGKILQDESPFKMSLDPIMLRNHMDKLYRDYSRMGILQKSDEIKNNLKSSTFFPETINESKFGEHLSKISMNFWLKYKLFFQGFSAIAFLLVFIEFEKRNFLLLTCSSIFIFILFLLKVIPLSSFNYDPMRLYYQSLFFLAPLTILGFHRLFSKLKINRQVAISILLIIFFIFSSGAFFQIIGGNPSKFVFNNNGRQYDVWNIDKDYILSKSWIQKNYNGNNKIFINNRYFYANTPSHMKMKNNIHLGISAGTFSKKDYILLDSPSVKRNRGFIFVKNREISYKINKNLLYKNKNIIYTNGGGKILK